MKLFGQEIDERLLADNEFKALLARATSMLDANPLWAYNNPDILPPEKLHRKQLEFHAIKPPPMGVKAAIAANRSGKTVACVVDDIIQLIDEEWVPEHLLPYKKWFEPVTIWIGAPKNDTHFKNTVPLFREYLPKVALRDGKFEKSFRTQPAPELRLANGSTVAFKTYDQDLDAWAAAEVHRIHWDEEPNSAKSAELRQEARARLISTAGDEIIGMTPLLGYSWVHDDVWEVRDTDPKVSVVQMYMEDNPWNSKEAIAEYEKGLTEEEKRMRMRGEFVHLGGLFFNEFRDRIHVVEPPEPSYVQEREIVVGIDPGLRHPTGVTWVAFDSENAAIVFDELCLSDTVVPDIAAEIKRRNAFWGIEPSTYVIDPSARNRTAINADQVEAAYMREEIYCQHGQNDRAAGIMEMKRRLQVKDHEGTPSPTLVFSRDCPGAIKEMERYRRDVKSKDEFAAVKEEDDRIDSARYAIMARTWHVPELSTQPRLHSTPDFQAPYSQERVVQDVPPLGLYS